MLFAASRHKFISRLSSWPHSGRCLRAWRSSRSGSDGAADASDSLAPEEEPELPQQPWVLGAYHSKKLVRKTGEQRPEEGSRCLPAATLPAGPVH